VLERAEKEDPTSSAETTAVDGSKHNFTQCCVAANVSKSCLGYCNLQNIIDGNTGENVRNCEVDFPKIINCMAGKKIQICSFMQQKYIAET